MICRSSAAASLCHDVDEDLVLARNEAALLAAEEAGGARLFVELPGGHDLRDYVRNGSLAGLVRTAFRLAP